MVEPVTIAADVVVGTAARAAEPVVRRAWREVRLLSAENPHSLRFVAQNGEHVGGLTANEVLDVEAFLGSLQVSDLLSVLFRCSVHSPDRMETARDSCGSTFADLAKRWCLERSQHWFRWAGELWVDFIRMIEALWPDQYAIDGFRDELADLPVQTAAGSKVRAASKAGTTLLQELLDLAATPDRLVAAAKLVSELAELGPGPLGETMLAHANLDTGVDTASLYIDRTVSTLDASIVGSTEELFAGWGHFRAVVLGPPGVGKSTLVAHIERRINTTAAESRRVCLVLSCKDYVVNAWGDSIAKALAANLHAGAGVDVAGSALEDALLLGRVTVIFDGIDEVVDRFQRIDLVSRIQKFSLRYQPASVLCTSRKVGYESARLDPGVFRTFELQDFVESDVAEYARRWFARPGSSASASAFLEDSESVSDLRANPLMLSLLCVLYGSRGSIPRKRRDIYSKCADLLFHRWDSLRHIEQPDDLPKYGDRLMQQIALWFFQMQSAQGGLEEGQLVKVVAGYLAQTAGVEEDEARRRAADFVDFCAGRAWLLAYQGLSPMGVRKFTFTHRTFFEFFAAEALSRRATSPQDVLKDIVAAYDRNDSSVLPDLLLQAYDERADNGGRDVFLRLCRERDRANGAASNESKVELLLRLMNVVPLAAYARDEAFDEMERVWQARKLPGYASEFHSLLSLQPDAREHFQRRFLASGSAGPVGDHFAHNWSRMDLASRLSTYADAWEGALQSYLLLDGPSGRASKSQIRAHQSRLRQDTAMENWLIKEGRAPVPSRIAGDHLCVPGFRSRSAWAPGHLDSVPGAVWVAFERSMLGIDSLGVAVDQPLLTKFLAAASSRSLGFKIMDSFFDATDERAEELLARLVTEAPGRHARPAGQSLTLLDEALLAMAVLEMECRGPGAIALSVASALTLPLEDAFAARELCLQAGRISHELEDREDELDHLYLRHGEPDADALKRLREEAPTWFMPWIDGVDLLG